MIRKRVQVLFAGHAALFVLLVGFSACSIPQKVNKEEGCESPLGIIPEGQSAIGYLHPLEQNQTSCEQGSLICQNGVWSGAYIYPTCVRLP